MGFWGVFYIGKVKEREFVIWGCLVCGKVLVFKAVFGRRFEMGFFSTILGFCGFGFGISIGLVAGYFLFIYFQPIDVEVPLYLSVSFWMFLCMYGHVLWKIFGLVCVVLIKIVTFFFFWCIWLLVAVIDFKKIFLMLCWVDEKAKQSERKRSEVLIHMNTWCDFCYLPM